MATKQKRAKYIPGLYPGPYEEEWENILKRLYDSIPNVSKEFTVRHGFIRRGLTKMRECKLKEDRDNLLETAQSALLRIEYHAANQSILPANATSVVRLRAAIAKAKSKGVS